MIELFSRLRRRLPWRRRRLWRYVSGRRRRAGLFVFAVLVLVAGGYWYLTNDARVQRKVQQYLHHLTGAEVKTESAQFSLFGGIQVSKLQIRTSDGKISFFEAPEVFISHRPSALLLRGALEPTGIVCVGATVRPVLDLQSGRWNLLIADWSGRSEGKREIPLVPIYLRDAKLETTEVLDGHQFRRPSMPMSISLLPDMDRRKYNIILADEAGTIQGRGTIDAVTGQTLIAGPVWEAGLDKTLPGQYLDWKKRYKLTFNQPWDVTVSLGGSSTTTEPAEDNRLIVALKDVSMELPPDEGGLKFTGVSGRLVFDRAGITIENLSGRIAQAGGADFTLSGRYEGYETDCPFQTSLTISDMTWPAGEDLAGVLGKTFAKFHKQIEPSGIIAISAVLHRDRQGRLGMDGRIELKKISLRLPYCTIRLDDVSGQVLVKGGDLQLMNLQGRYEKAVVEVSGRLTGPVDRLAYDVRVVARDMPMEKELRDALPEDLRSVWDQYSPRGYATFIINAKSGDESSEPTRDITMEFHGKASFEYAGFPYRLERVFGKVITSGRDVRFVSIRGIAGPMQCVLNGTAVRKPGPDDFKITADIVDLPLDNKVARALPERIGKAYLSYGLTGRADITDAVVWRENGGTVQCDVPVVLKNAGIRHNRFPFAIERVSGAVGITREKVTIHRLVGWRGRANINITGSVPVRQDARGADLVIEATDLSLDSALRQALPAGGKRGWDLLAPSGTANVTMRLFGSVKTETAPAGTTHPSTPSWSYRLIVLPRDMQIKCHHFPYPLKLTGGTAIVKPDAMTLDSLSGLAGDAKVVLDGRVSLTAGNEQTDLRVRTGAIALDKQFLSAMPKDLAEAMQLHPGGTVELQLKNFQLRRQDGPKGGFAWRWSGKVIFTDVVTDLGMGAKQISGWVEGEMACDGPAEKLTAEANVFMGALQVGPRRLEKITAGLHKTAKSPMLKIDKISGQVFGGRVAGFAQVRLDKPAKYGLSLSVENIDLAEFLKSEAKDPGQSREVSGVLAGNIQLTAAVGDRASRRATGRLRIEQAKMYRLPILLGFLHVVNLTLPTESAFHTGQIDYYLEGGTLVFREIHLQGSALSMLGAGNMDMKSGKMNLTFLTGPPRKLPRLAALSEVLEGIASQLMTVRVTGTLDKPRVKTTAFRGLDATMRELLEPGR
ncbi:MAG: AsmA-like C-terminal region-containing protein [Planctomycetota bacterium]|nr:AsmA-like C-terminal region-containing protein [Planctomycetota bacterium]